MLCLIQDLATHVEQVRALSSLLRSLLKKAEQDVGDSLEEFMRCKKDYQLGAAIGGYFRCFNTFGVKTRSEVEKKWAELYGKSEMREALDDLYDVEENWNQFLEKGDDMLESKCGDQDKVVAGMDAPRGIPLIDVNTKRYRIVLQDHVRWDFLQIPDSNH